MIRRAATTAIPERYRDACAALASIALAIAAGLLMLAGHDHPTRRQSATPPRPAAPAATPAPGASHTPTPPPASSSWRVAHAFLSEYLRYLYGHDPQPALPGASSPLRARLLAHPPAAGMALRARRPRLAGLMTVTVGASHTGALATVTDGDVRYPIVLSLTARQGRWEVTGVAGE